MARSVPIEVLPGCRGRIPVPELRRIARHVLDAEDVAPEVQVEIVLADDDTVRNLNRLYRGKDESTDVLSFATRDDELDWPSIPEDANSPSPKSERGPGGEVDTPSLGEIVICVPFVEASMAENPATRTVRGQIAHLLVHGLLHLLGYDHEGAEPEAQRMQEREEALLAALGYEGAYEHGH